MTEFAGVAVSIVSAVIGVAVWLLRLEGRVTGHESICVERHRHLAESAEQNLHQHEELRQTLVRNGVKLDAISSKVDTVIGQLSHPNR